MNEIVLAILTSSLSLGIGIILYLINKICIDPFFEFKKILGEIIDNLIFYANIYHNKNIVKTEDLLECSNKIRKLSCILYSKKYTLINYKLFQKIKLINIKEDDIHKIHRELVRLSNLTLTKSSFETSEKHMDKCIGNLEKYLNIKLMD